MSYIDKIDTAGEIAAFAYGLDHPAVALWSAPQTGVLHRARDWLQREGIHPARAVFVLPYAQLRPLAARLWARTFGAGFAPRFETSTSWCRALGAAQTGSLDIQHDMALDLLTAQDLLERAGMGQHLATLAPLLVQAAQQLGGSAAAYPPARRETWALRARAAVEGDLGGSFLAMESALGRIAVEWAAASSYPTDALFDPALRNNVDGLVLVQGLQADPLMAGLAESWGQAALSLPLAPTPSDSVAIGSTRPIAGDKGQGTGFGKVTLFAGVDAEEEAALCAARAIARINAGHYPLALVSSDRSLTRRIRSLLELAGVQMRDENGWKLSTSSAGALVMTFLRAMPWNASADAVLNCLKASPSLVLTPAQHPESECAELCDALESALRKDQVRDWRAAAKSPQIRKSAELLAAVESVGALQSQFKGRLRLAQWLGLLREIFQGCGLLERLEADEAGRKVLQALHLGGDAPVFEDGPESAVWSQRIYALHDFSQWVNQVLESQSFQPPYPAQEEVVILPMSQMLGRPFAAVLLAGCDEVRLNPSAEPPGHWTAAQRRQLGLPSRDELSRVVEQSWRYALQTPLCDIFWRKGDEAGEVLRPSALVKILPEAARDQALMPDPRRQQALETHPVQQAVTVAPDLVPQQVTQGAYEDLRNCPYRFFAMRQLGLQGIEELEADVDKRDLGLWLHDVLKRFHEALDASPTEARLERLELINQASADASLASGLSEAEFLPYAAAWPALRDRYLDWLEVHEKTGARFATAETSYSQDLGAYRLYGRIDRTDHAADGNTLVIDYKTEAAAKTTARVKDPLEDTQMAFYAALLGGERVRGIYLALGERDPVKAVEQVHILAARDALLEGLLNDLERIKAGAPLKALGEGATCEFCQARGLCRKDFWGQP